MAPMPADAPVISAKPFVEEVIFNPLSEWLNQQGVGSWSEF
jgi:hypothetical protein